MYHDFEPYCTREYPLLFTIVIKEEDSYDMHVRDPECNNSVLSRHGRYRKAANGIRSVRNIVALLNITVLKL